VPVVLKTPVLQCAVLAAVGSMTYWLAMSDVEDCNVCVHKRRCTDTNIE